MTDSPSMPWQIAFFVLLDVGMIAVAASAVYLYFVVLSQGSRRADLRLNRLERRLASVAALRETPSHRAWRRFRVKHLPTAQGVRRAQRLLFRPAAWMAVVIAIDLFGLAALLATASATGVLPHSWDGMVLALVFFAPVPWLAATFLEQAMWRWRARSEWQVVLLGETLSNEASRDVDQDHIGRRTARILGSLGTRLRGKSARRGQTAEGREWLVKTERCVQMRAELVTTDVTDKREWSGWVASWLDAVSESFDPRQGNAPSSTTPSTELPANDPDLVGFGALIATCCAFAAVGVVLALTSNGFDAAAALHAWDSTAGRLTTGIGLVGTVLSIIGFRRR